MMELDGRPLTAVNLTWLVDTMTPLLVTHRTVLPSAERATLFPVSPAALAWGALDEMRDNWKQMGPCLPCYTAVRG